MDNHVEMMFQAESNVRAQAGVSASATRPGSDTAAIMAQSGFVNTPASQGQVERLWNEVVVAAFASGLSQIYVWGPDDEYTFSPIARGPWHDGIAHALNNNPTNQEIFNNAVQLQFGERPGRHGQQDGRGAHGGRHHTSGQVAACVGL